MIGVGVICPVTVDCLFSGFDTFPVPGEEKYAKHFEMQLGGGSTVIPVRLRQLGVETRLGTFLGQDTLSSCAEQLLAQQGFTDYVNLYTGSGCPVIISSVFSLPQDRCFLTYTEDFTDKDLPADTVYSFLKGSKICFAPENVEAARRLHRDGTLLVFDVGWHDDLDVENYKEILQYVDFFSPNEKEALKMTGCETVEEALKCLRQYTRCPIVKTGKTGCVAYDGHTFIHADAVSSLKAVDTTGAGDNFLTGLVYGLYRDLPLQQCMQIANITGGLSTTGLGCYGRRYTSDDIASYL